MIRFRDLSIRKKLNISLMGISSIAVLVACVAFYALIVEQYKKAYSEDLQSLAKIIGFNCQAALTFNIQDDAENMLESLASRPSILVASIYDQQHDLFAGYGDQTLSRVHPEGHHSGEITEEAPPGKMMIHEDILMNGQKIGCITMIDDMRSILAFRKIAISTISAIFILVIALSLFVATRLRELIAKPISDLASISEEVSEKQDYSLRALRQGGDEVGHLVDSFNEMLEQISERNQELQKSEYRFRALVDQAVDAFFLHDIEGKLIDVNLRACETLGYTREELLSVTIEDIDQEADNLLYKEQWSKMAVNEPVTFIGVHVRKDGSTFPVEVRAGLLELGNQNVIMALARDMSERIASENEKHLLETQLQQAQKMESIGTLAAGIAHDFNNILSPIYGYVELAQMKVDENSELKGYLDEVRSAAHRAKDLVKQILTFSRQDAGKRSPVEINVIIKEAMKLLRATIPTTIEIRQQIDPKCGLVMANPTQIHQVLMNLCTNAYHAMRDTGGILGVSLSPVEITSEDSIKSIKLGPGKYLMLEISDTGVGMDRETTDRIFEPYFTTKALGEGTGMGLSVVHGIVKTHGGSITVYSEPGKGSTFHVYLPALEKSVSHDKTEPTGPIPTGVEKILLVDDEESVIKVMKKMLVSLGYHVTSTTSPMEALQDFSEHPGYYDLVITDMTMPSMTGDILAMEMMTIRPEIPVIMCTGFSDLVSKEEAMKIGIKQFITKPIVINTFARSIREVLEAG